jgi:hypothetical protein
MTKRPYLVLYRRCVGDCSICSICPAFFGVLGPLAGREMVRKTASIAVFTKFSTGKSQELWATGIETPEFSAIFTPHRSPPVLPTWLWGAACGEDETQSLLERRSIPWQRQQAANQ